MYYLVTVFAVFVNAVMVYKGGFETGQFTSAMLTSFLKTCIRLV